MLQHLEQLVGAFEQGQVTRRQLVARLGALLAAGVGWGRAQADETDEPAPTFKVTELNHIALDVKDLARSRDWYRRHLGMHVTSESDLSCFMRCGPHFLALFRTDGAPGMNHYCYSIDDYRPGPVMERLDAAGLKPLRHGNRLYFDDPDGLVVQLANRNHWE